MINAMVVNSAKSSAVQLMINVAEVLNDLTM